MLKIKRSSALAHYWVKKLKQRGKSYDQAVKILSAPRFNLDADDLAEAAKKVYGPYPKKTKPAPEPTPVPAPEATPPVEVPASSKQASTMKVSRHAFSVVSALRSAGCKIKVGDPVTVTAALVPGQVSLYDNNSDVELMPGTLEAATAKDATLFHSIINAVSRAGYKVTTTTRGDWAKVEAADSPTRTLPPVYSEAEQDITHQVDMSGLADSIRDTPPVSDTPAPATASPQSPAVASTNTTAAGWDSIKRDIMKQHKVEVEKLVQTLIRDYESTGKYNLFSLARDFITKNYPGTHPGWVKGMMSLLSEEANKEWPRKPRRRPEPEPQVAASQHRIADKFASYVAYARQTKATAAAKADKAKSE